MKSYVELSEIINNEIERIFKEKIESLDLRSKNLLERSYFQYLCQMYNVPFLIKMTQNLLAIPLIVYYLMM